MHTEDSVVKPTASGEVDRASEPASAPEARAAATTDSIAARQNAVWSIQLLAAQRQFYSDAKRWRRLRAWSVTAVAVIGVGATLLAPDLLKILGPVGTVLGVAQWVASVIEKQRTKMAANIQEQFDTSVYLLNWNPVLGAKADAEDVVAAASRFKGDRAKLADWYSIPDGVPRPLDVLLCQRSNLRWDAVLRRAYANTILVGLVVLFLVIVAAGLAQGLSLREFGLALLPSVGAFLLGAETVRSHRQHSSAQLDLKRKLEAAWDKARANPRSVREQELRAIQDGIYQLRAVAPPVPDGFYWRRRDQFEREMRLATERMWEEAEVAARSSRRGPAAIKWRDRAVSPGSAGKPQVIET